jgi:CBS domain-containing protein
MQPISSIMARDVVSVQADDNLVAVTDALLRHGLSFVPVLDRAGGTLLGIISADDVLQQRQRGRDPDKLHAWEICAYRPVEIGPDTPVGEVARMMVERQIHHVIVTQNRSLLGVVSSLDFVRQFMSGQSGSGD